MREVSTDATSMLVKAVVTEFAVVNVHIKFLDWFQATLWWRSLPGWQENCQHSWGVLIYPVIPELCNSLQGALLSISLLHGQLSDTSCTRLPGK